MSLTNCPNCKAPASGAFCQYCGTDLTLFVKRDSSSFEQKEKEQLFQHLRTARFELGVMRGIYVPTAKHNYIAGVYWTFVLFTFGLSAIVWRRKRAKFEVANFDSHLDLADRSLKQAQLAAAIDPSYNDEINGMFEELSVLKKKNQIAKVTKLITILLIPVLIFIIFGLIGVVIKLTQNTGNVD